VPLWTKIIYEQPKQYVAPPPAVKPAVKPDDSQLKSNLHQQESKVGHQQQPSTILEQEQSKSNHLQ